MPLRPDIAPTRPSSICPVRQGTERAPRVVIHAHNVACSRLNPGTRCLCFMSKPRVSIGRATFAYFRITPTDHFGLLNSSIQWRSVCSIRYFNHYIPRLHRYVVSSRHISNGSKIRLLLSNISYLNQLYIGFSIPFILIYFWCIGLRFSANVMLTFECLPNKHVCW